MPVLTRPRRAMAAAMRRRWVSGRYRSNWPARALPDPESCSQAAEVVRVPGQAHRLVLCRTGPDDCSVLELRLLACATLLDAAQTPRQEPRTRRSGLVREPGPTRRSTRAQLRTGWGSPGTRGPPRRAHTGPCRRWRGSVCARALVANQALPCRDRAISFRPLPSDPIGRRKVGRKRIARRCRVGSRTFRHPSPRSNLGAGKERLRLDRWQPDTA